MVGAAPEGTATAFRGDDRGVRVQLLYFDGCPSWQVAEARLHEALEATGSSVEVEKVLVTTPEQAEEWNFVGSPSVLVDGEDLFPEPGAPVGLACRLYRTPEGLRGSPTVSQLVAALAGEPRR